MSTLFALIACHRSDLAPRDIEVMDESSSLGYAARMRYMRAIHRLNGAGIEIGQMHVAQAVRVSVAGECRSLEDQRWFLMRPRTVDIEPNRCKIIPLWDMPMKQAVPLQLCYINRKLYVDPDPSNKIEPYQFSIFYPSALWRIAAPMEGIRTAGLASLRHASLAIRYVNMSAKALA